MDVGTSERVNTLRIVAHDTNILMHRRQFLRDHVLHVVGVLILIHHDVFELVLPFITHIQMIVEQFIGVQKDIVEVHCAGLEASGGIF